MHMFRTRNRIAVLALGAAGLFGLGFAAAVATIPEVRSTDDAALKGTKLETLAPFIGDWEIETAWANGMELWARNEYRVVMDGKFVEAVTYAKDGDADPYARYLTLYRWDDEQGTIVAHGFQNDGTVSVRPMQVGADGSLSAEWAATENENGPKIKQTVSTPAGDAYRWQVWMLQPGGAGEMQMIDGEWKRTD
ncbi:MAG: hypothetical protein CMJ31_02045 [Phycisphaerae bacterium]|nr:hypothetical protein [Phycisphaerae bacterium]